MLRASASLLTICLAAAGAAHAQPQYDPSGYPGPDRYAAPTPPDPRTPPPESYGDGSDSAAGARQASGSDAALAPPDLTRALGLRPGQQAALQAYQAATTPTAAERRQMDADLRRVATMTTPERLDFAAAQMRRDEADFARRADAVRQFYTQLTPEQRQRFDRLTGPDAASPEEPAGYDEPSPRPPR